MLALPDVLELLRPPMDAALLLTDSMARQDLTLCRTLPYTCRATPNTPPNALRRLRADLLDRRHVMRQWAVASMPDLLA